MLEISPASKPKTQEGVGGTLSCYLYCCHYALLVESHLKNNFEKQKKNNNPAASDAQLCIGSQVIV